MMNNTKVFSINKIILILIALIIIGLFLTYLMESFTIFPIKTDLKTMLFTIWSVQASVSTLTIAILALLINSNKEKIYGINILQFMLISNRKFLTFQDEVLLILLLIFIQYFFVSFLWLSGSIILLIATFFIIIRILYVSIEVLLFKDRVQTRIKNYISSSINETLIEENKLLGDNNSGKNN